MTGAGPRYYQIGGTGWGNEIAFQNGVSLDSDGRPAHIQNVTGFKTRIPRVGDLLVVAHESGPRSVWRFTAVRRAGDPEDLFFGTVIYVDIEDNVELPPRG
jgi:hypothetical protein